MSETFRDILEARPRVYRHVSRTPLHSHRGLSDLLGADVWVKHENHHALGAFKVRGGINLAAQLTPEERAGGLYTASTGNHGQSIANGGRLYDTQVTVAVPEGANPDKVASMRRLGAEVVERGRDFDAAREWAAGVAREKGGRFIGNADPELIAGVGTYAMEIFEDLPDVDVIIVPIGSGSGASGVCLAASALSPGTQVIGVQAEKAPAAYRSWKEGRLVEASMETRAEGVATRVPFENAQQILRKHLEDFVLVSDEAMEEGIRLMLEHTHNLAEDAGAAPLAAALQLRDRLAGRRVALVQTGGNLSSARLREILG